MNKYKHVKNYLFARPSFIAGIARIFDIGGTLQEYNFSKNYDYKSLLNDWYTVGDDMRSVMKQEANILNIDGDDLL